MSEERRFFTIGLDIRVFDEDAKRKLDELSQRLRSTFTVDGRPVEYVRNIRELGTASRRTIADMEPLHTQLTQMELQGRITTEEVRNLIRYMDEMGLSSKQQFYIWQRGIAMGGDLSRNVKELADSFNRQRLTMQMLTETTRELYARLGPVRMGYMKIARSMFWVGLGTMFTVMSIARLLRQMRSAQTATLSLRRAYLDLIERQEELRMQVQMYGRTTIEGKRAQLELETLLERVRLAEENLIYTTQQQTLAWMMLIMGAIPTFIRSASDLQMSLLWTSIAQQLTAQSGMQLQTSINLSDVAILKHIPIVNTLTLSYWQFGLAISAVTFGLSLLVGVLSMTWAVENMRNRIRELREEFGVTEDMLTGHSLVDSIREATRATQEWSEVLPEPLAFGRMRSSRVETVMIGNILVNVNAGNGDPRRISREIGRALSSEIRRITGRI